MITVFFTPDDPSLVGDALKERLSALPPSRKESALAQRTDAAKRQRLLAWELLCLACNRLSLPTPPTIIVDANGKPDFADSPLRFNLSHAAIGVAVAISDMDAVGVDLESIRPYNARTARFFCSAAEQEQLSTLANTDPTAANSLFTRLWTAKESHAKYTGKGIGRRMREIPLTAVASKPIPFDGSLPPSGWLSVAKADGEIAWYEIPPEALLPLSKPS